MTGFDEARREWQFERLADGHRHCCCGAVDFDGTWVSVILADFEGIRGWDEPFDAWSQRLERETAA